MVIVFAGTLDEGLQGAEPAGELWVKHRANWLPALSGKGQMQEFN